MKRFTLGFITFFVMLISKAGWSAPGFCPESPVLTDDKPERYAFCEPYGIYLWPKSYLPKGKDAILMARDYLEDFYPGLIGQVPVNSSTLNMVASPGEWEPASFLVVAPTNLNNVEIRVTDLKNGSHYINSKKSITLRRVVRTYRRKAYYQCLEKQDLEVVGRYLPRWSKLSIPEGEFRQAWLQVYVPTLTPPGVYQGGIKIFYNGQLRKTLPFSVKVLPITLVRSPDKTLGMSYLMAGRIKRGETERATKELRDMAAHGVRVINPNLEIEYEVSESGEVTHNLDTVLAGLKLIKETKVPWKTVVILPELNTLAWKLGHRDILDEEEHRVGTGASLIGDVVFKNAAIAALSDLSAKIDALNLPFGIVYRNLDEIFDKKYLPLKPAPANAPRVNSFELYKIYAGIAREVPGLNLSTTISTAQPEQDEMRQEIDSIVDTRIHHGASFERWLQKPGNSIDGYTEELKSSVDAGWFYHNEKGEYHTAEWARIVTGLFFWASPFSVHIPFNYQIFSDDAHPDDSPFDDTTGSKHGSFGFSFPSGTGRFALDLVPTTSWEAMREGMDDVRYFYTAHAIAYKQRKGNLPEPLKSDVEAFFVKLKDLVAQNIGAPKIFQNGKASESPLILGLSSQFTGQEWQALRGEAVNLILRLQQL